MAEMPIVWEYLGDKGPYGEYRANISGYRLRAWKNPAMRRPWDWCVETSNSKGHLRWVAMGSEKRLWKAQEIAEAVVKARRNQGF